VSLTHLLASGYSRSPQILAVRKGISGLKPYPIQSGDLLTYKGLEFTGLEILKVIVFKQVLIDRSTTGNKAIVSFAGNP
ncbi:MAG: hypothetical protein ACO3EZ_11740, partial [Prochlorotrichaceae cyanobacterium]